ncbi:hypothetical protein V6N13_074980 [Hibiscus sabdariffa]|uniref:Uncharacterized protein n=1 Tax=Hibiscus sabdariffa TaxID=183260 RepID=A0ABR2UA67_9ROSI
MASPISFYLLLLALLLQTHLSLSTAYPTNGRRSVPEVHDLLPSYKLPKGIIPDNVKSYTLSSTGEFTIELESSCYVHFDELVYYEKTIRGRLSYGAVHDVPMEYPIWSSSSLELCLRRCLCMSFEIFRFVWLTHMRLSEFGIDSWFRSRE